MTLFLCDFCGGAQWLRCYPTDMPDTYECHVCGVCVRLIREEAWDSFIERVVAAFAALQYISDIDQSVFRHELAKALCQPVEEQIKVSRLSPVSL